MKPNRTDILLAEVRSCLEQNILPYWLTLADPKGGFQGEVLADGTVLPDAPRGAILNARIIWAFSAAYAALHKSEYLVAAMHPRSGLSSTSATTSTAASTGASAPTGAVSTTRPSSMPRALPSMV